MIINPSIDKVYEYAASGKYDVVPLYAEILSDIKTPIEALRVLLGASNHVYMLESAEDNKTWGRYTFLGYDPKSEIVCRDGVMNIDGRRFKTGHPGDEIRKILRKHRSPKVEGLPSFTGGLVGYFSYDYLKYAEPTLKLDAKDSEGFNDVDVMLFDKVIAFDNYRQKIVFIVNMPISDEFASPDKGRCPQSGRRGLPPLEGEASDSGTVTDASMPPMEGEVPAKRAEGFPAAEETVPDWDSFRKNYEKAARDLEEMVNLIKYGEPKKDLDGHLLGEVKPYFSKEQYCEMVERAKHHIFEGDIFQIVLSNRFEAPFEGSLLNTYRILRSLNPSPYMFYFSSDDIEVAGASPETLVKLKDGVLHTFPLAGTRPRGKDAVEDAEFEASLLADEKELAEHNMLVDLGRNDIGKISEFGTVAVESYHEVLKFSHVMHIGSTVKGQIRSDKDALDAIDAILPAGTLSGAPKIRACQLINDLENNKRGIYGGAIGYIDFTGNLDTCIAIRIAYAKGGKVFVRSGAGIVADSVPATEFTETVNKAKAVVTALSEAENIL